jgi:hypothetical protein
MFQCVECRYNRFYASLPPSATRDQGRTCIAIYQTWLVIFIPSLMEITRYTGRYISAYSAHRTNDSINLARLSVKADPRVAPHLACCLTTRASDRKLQFLSYSFLINMLQNEAPTMSPVIPNVIITSELFMSSSFRIAWQWKLHSHAFPGKLYILIVCSLLAAVICRK